MEGFDVLIKKLMRAFIALKIFVKKIEIYIGKMPEHKQFKSSNWTENRDFL